MVFYYNQPKDTIRKYKISELTDSTLVFKEKGISYHFTKEKAEKSTGTNWQLSSNIIYEDPAKYPDSIKQIVEFTKGVDFLSLNDNGSYENIFDKNYNKGYWLRNNNLIVFKQKAPQNIDVYFEIVKETKQELVLKKGGNQIYKFISSNHPDYVSIKKEKSMVLNVAINY